MSQSQLKVHTAKITLKKVQCAYPSADLWHFSCPVCVCRAQGYCNFTPSVCSPTSILKLFSLFYYAFCFTKPMYIKFSFSCTLPIFIKSCNAKHSTSGKKYRHCPGYTVSPIRYRTQHSFNHSNTNEDIATKFEQEYIRCVRNENKCVPTRSMKNPFIQTRDWCLVWDVLAAHNLSHLL